MVNGLIRKRFLLRVFSYLTTVVYLKLKPHKLHVLCNLSCGKILHNWRIFARLETIETYLPTAAKARSIRFFLY